MKFRQSSVVYMVLGIFLALICALHVSGSSVAADVAGPDWLSGAITADSFKELSLTPELMDAMSSGFQRECITATSWGGTNNYFGVTPREQSTTSCAVQTATGYMADRNYLGYGDKYWQLFDIPSGMLILPAPGKTSAIIADNYYSPNDYATFHYASNFLDIYRTFKKDNVGNVIRSVSGEYNFTLNGADGKPLLVDKISGFSANGRWVYVSGYNKSDMVFDTDTKQTLAFAPYQRQYYSRSVSVSNSGRFVATSEKSVGFFIYDLNRCETEKPDFESRNCEKRNIVTDVQDAYKKTMANPENFASFNVVALKFENESTLTVTAVVSMRDGTGGYVSFDVHVDPGPQTTRYLAMGDSFSSGEGVSDYYEATNFTADKDNNFNQCHQSRLAYSEILNKTLMPDWYSSVTCSGAMMKDVVFLRGDDYDYINSNGNVSDGDSKPQAKAPNEDSDFIESVKSSLNPGYIPQLSLLKAHPSTVSTITIGGNDIGFGDIVTACVWQIGCYSSRNDRESIADLVKRQIPGLVNTYNTIKQNMSGSNPQLYVVGYPRIFNLDNLCASFMGRGEREFANSLVDYLNAAIKTAASEANVRYIDVSDAFIDYTTGQDFRLCGNASQAINGLTIDMKNSSDAQSLQQYLTSSYHPNELGHKLLAKRIRSYTNDFKLSMPSTTVSTDGPSIDLYRQLVGDTEDRLADVAQINLDVVQGSVFEKGDSLDVSFKSDPQDVPISGNAITVEIHSEPVTLATLTVGSDGTASAHIPLPTNIVSGPHEVHILYTDIAGQKHDSYKHIYVIASLTDFDGDGIPNDKEQCVIGGTLGVDADHDGKDDACDPEIVEKEVVVNTQETIDKKADDNKTAEPEKDAAPSSSGKVVNELSYDLGLARSLSIDNVDITAVNSPLHLQSKPDLNDAQNLLQASSPHTSILSLPSNPGVEGVQDVVESKNDFPPLISGATNTASPKAKDQTAEHNDSLLMVLGVISLTVLLLAILVLKRKRIPKQSIER